MVLSSLSVNQDLNLPDPLVAYLANLDEAVRALAMARNKGSINALDRSYLALLAAEKENVVNVASTEAGQTFLASNTVEYALACVVAGEDRKCTQLVNKNKTKDGKPKRARARSKKDAANARRLLRCGKAINGPQLVCTACQREANPTEAARD